MDYITQINRAIDHIEENLLNPVTVDEISKVAGLSKWYFQRIFQAVIGETVKEYISLRRLSLAATELITTDKNILDIALTHEFESHEVFTRAFRRTFKMTPTEFRSFKDAHLLIPFKPKVTLEYINHLYQGISMNPKIVQLPERTVIGLSTTIKPIHEALTENQKAISALWDEFRSVLKDCPHITYEERVSVMKNLEYLAGFIPGKNTITPNEFTNWTIPAGEYVEFIHLGPMQDVGKTYNYIYGSWFPRSDRMRTAGPEFAVSAKDSDPTSETAELRIYIPLM